ncbi:S8 family serine peptidase, partial [bacterium]|nr:S8 family serine peptidase [bacterium]
HGDVQWIEPRPLFTTDNSSVQWVDQTNINGNRKIWDNGIDGTGQVVMVGDSGIRTSHNMFRDGSTSITSFGDYPTHRKVIAYARGLQSTNVTFGDASGAAYHGTHTCGTFFGNDSPWASSALDGIAKGAKVYFVDCGGSTNSIYSPGDLNEYFGPSYLGNAGGAARVSSNSWGASTGGAYTISCMTTDQFMWDHKDYLICFSNGNSGTSGSVGSPGAAKNILSSGGTRNGTSANLLYNSTSRGPTQDGRYKPTVCSPGQSVQSAYGGSDTGYQTLSGTSMSCPNLAGSATLARQYFADGWYPTGAAVPANAFEPSAALLKAMMVNSGVDDFSSYGIPDNNIGWGRILLDNVMYFPGDGRATVLVDEADGVATGEAREYEIHVASASEDLKITLVWTDVASTPAAGTNLVNDLDLVVEQGATTYRGNVWSGGQSVTGGSADMVNVEENVRRASPVAGNYTIRVEGANVPFGPQPYAIVVSGDLGGSAGVVLLDAAAYGPGESVGVRVEDTNGGGSVAVTMSSTTEAGGETFVITGSDGVYEASIPLTLAAANGSDGQLSVGQDDVITATYTDSSPSHTASASATIDADDPQITGVSSTAKDTRATVFWTTDGAATSQIAYGTTPSLGSLSTLDPSLVTGHAHEVTGLTAETTYYFDILSEDHEGNLVRDDFGGNHYRFTTNRRADVLLVEADGNTTENLDRYDAAFDATGWTFDRWNKADADVALVGDNNSGLRSYNAVWWQVGWEQYPCFVNDQRDSLMAYHDGGGRLAMVSHDVAWSFSDGSSGFWGPAKVAWYQDITHSAYDADPLAYSSIVGIGGDPISGGKTGGMSYTPHRDGAAGDELTKLDGSGTASYVWRNNDTSPDDVSVRWQSGGNLGTPGVGVWGGQPTRTVFMAWEFLNLNNATDRADVLDETVQYLIGGDHPDAAIVSPNGGGTITTSPASISWTAGTDVGAGRNLGGVRLEYSDDSGMSWNLITAAPGSSPYSW